MCDSHYIEVIKDDGRGWYSVKDDMYLVRVYCDFVRSSETYAQVVGEELARAVGAQLSQMMGVPVRPQIDE